MNRPRPVIALVSWLLWLANSDPPFCRKREFYAMKDRLLKKYGKHVGCDWQEITRKCYGCEGSGDHLSDGLPCRRCGGSGVYDRSWSCLERWELGGRVFHSFCYRRANKPEATIAIVGRIEHADHGRAADEAALWLALAFDRPTFRRLMLGSCARGATWRYPLVTLQKLTMRLALAAAHFERRRCVTCGRRFRQGFRAWRMLCFCCRRCERRITPLDVPEDETIPF